MSSCAHCGCSLPVPDGEYADPDARFLPCAAIAETDAARQRIRSGLILLGCSGLTVLVLVFMWRAKFDVAVSDGDDGGSLFAWVFMLAVTLFALGVSRMPRLRRSLKT
jgi:hypothetical protein